MPDDNMLERALEFTPGCWGISARAEFHERLAAEFRAIRADSIPTDYAALRKVAEAAKSLSSLANEPGYMGGVEGWEHAECVPMDRSGKRPTQAKVVHEPECFQGAASTLRAALKELEKVQ